MRQLALALVLLPLAATAAPHTLVYRAPTDTRPAFAAGDLSGPTTLAPEAAARAFLQTAEHLAPVDLGLVGPATVRHLERGAVVRFALAHAGVPVADATVAVRLDHAGRARLVLGSPVRVDPAASPIPFLDLGDARRLLAATHAAHRAGQVEHATARLVWTPAPDRTLLLAWEFRLPPTPVLAESLLFRVDANTGALLTSRNLVRFADQAKVYPTNPVKSTLTTVTLPGRAPNAGQPADALSNPYVNVVNCIDEHQLTPISVMGYNLNVHMCTEKSTVVKDANGDYLQYDPANPDTWGPDPATSPADEDAFAEVQMYHHVMTAYAYFQAFGNPAFTQLDWKPILATVNFRFPIDASGPLDIGTILTQAQNPNGTLYSFENAMFMPPGEIFPGVVRPASILFAQGENADYAYDGDVVFHEFTHGVIYSTSQIGGFGIDEQGLDPAPGGMGEGFPDVFSGFISGDATTGDYAFNAMPEAIRDMSKIHRCPDLLWGEVHQDSLPMSSAAFMARQEIGQAAEAPIFAALVALPSDASFAVAAAAIEAELQDAIGASAAATAHAKFQERNLLDCRRVIDYTGPRPLLFAEGTSIGLSPAPAYLQFKYSLAQRASSLHVQFGWNQDSRNLTFLTGGGSPAYAAYVRKGAPITWTYGSTTATAAKDHDFALSSADNGATYMGDLQQVLDPGDYYVMVVGTGDGSGLLRNLSISHVAAPQDDAGAPPDDAGGADAGGGGGRGSGCGCRAAAPEGLGLLALLGLGLLLVRRRR